MDGNTLVSVRNRNNGFTGYEIPDKGIWRNFAPNEVKNVSLEELKSLQYQPGGEYLLDNFLIVEDEEALKELNMDVELEYNYTEKEIRELLLSGTMDQFLDFLDFAPDGAIEIAKEIAVKEEIPDVRKRDAISEKTGFNINNAINVNHIMASDGESNAPKQEKKQRRAAAPAKTQRRAQTDNSAAKPATPNYKVVTK